MDERIRVTDKRMFTAEGELRGDDQDQVPEPSASNNRPEPTHVDADPRTERGVSKTAAPQQPARDSQEEFSDETARRHASVRDDHLPTPTFVDLIGMLAQPIAMFLGDARLPGGEAEENLPLARFHIDLLELVENKTRGNISPEEAKLLEDMLFQLRLRYVEKVGKTE